MSGLASLTSDGTLPDMKHSFFLALAVAGMLGGYGLGRWQAGLPAGSRWAAPFRPGGGAAKTAASAQGERPASPRLAEEWDFLASLRATPLDDFPTLWDDSRESEEGKSRRRAILEQWVLIDPKRAFSFLLRTREFPLESNVRWHDWLPDLFAEWFRLHPETLEAAFGSKGTE